MSNTQLAVMQTGLTDEELMLLTGQGQAQRPRLPRLMINKEGVDEHENAIPVGTFQISQGEAHALYAKTAVFRPFINTFQYSIYDAAEKKTTNRSIHIKNWGDEAIDEKGGVRCGKVPNKQAASLSAEEQEKNKLIKCARHMYGTVTLNGVDEKGEKGEVVDLPVKMKLSGSNFMPFGDAINLVNALKRPIFSFNFNLSLTRHKNGATTWYIMGVDPDLKSKLEFTKENQELWMNFQGMIDKENEFITGKYREALKLRNQPSIDTSKVIDALSDDLTDLPM